MTEYEKKIFEDLIEAGTIKFYRRYVDDTLVLIKPCDVPLVLKKFNSFDKNLNFTVDKFEDGKVHFVDHIATRLQKIIVPIILQTETFPKYGLGFRFLASKARVLGQKTNPQITTQSY